MKEFFAYFFGAGTEVEFSLFTPAHFAPILLMLGLANDEIGYIVPPSDFLLNETLPYIEKTMDHKGENHYEETNSVGPLCAQAIADAFERAVQQLNLLPDSSK